MEKARIQVAAGILRNEFGQIYLAQRLEGQDFAQALEFPGGKLMASEAPEAALCRELEEETGVVVLNSALYAHFEYEYPTKIIEFFFYLVEEWVGEPFGREGQAGFWIAQSELDESQFPPANSALVARLKADAKHGIA